jgi:hypothetical protein
VAAVASGLYWIMRRRQKLAAVKTDEVEVDEVAASVVTERKGEQS